MTPVPPTPPPGPGRKSLWEDLARTAAEELSGGAEQFRQAGLRPPPEGARARQFVHGLLLPLVIARIMWRDVAARRQYLRVVAWQATVVALLGLGFAWSSDDWRKDVEAPEALRARAAVRLEEAARLRAMAEAPAEQLQPHLEAALLEARHAEASETLAVAEERVEDVGARVRRRAAQTERARLELERAKAAAEAGALASALAAYEEAQEREAAALAQAAEAETKLEAARAAVAALGPAPAAPRRERDPLDVRITVGEGLNYQLSGGEEPRSAEAASAEALAAQVASYISDDLLAEEVAADRLPLLRRALTRSAEVEAQRAGELESQAAAIDARGGLLIHKGLLFWAALITALYVVQTVVIYLSRDYHDVIERHASLAVGLPPEASPERPRVRLDLRWLRKKVRRRWRGFWLFALGLPYIWLVALPLPFSQRAVSLLSAAWFSWWWTVWTAAKTSASWDEAAQDPWFVRALDVVARRVPVLRWLGYFGRSWRKQMGDVVSPAACVERQLWAMAGLSLARGLGSLPFLKVFWRPFFPVAAAHLISERRAIAPPPQPAHPDVEAGRGD